MPTAPLLCLAMAVDAMRIALIGDGQSPHLLKWARALAASPRVELWAASSRGFLPEFDVLMPAGRRLALGTQANHAGGNLQVLQGLPALGRWLKAVDADWLHAHYLTSHGTLAWAAKRLWRLRAGIVGSAWGSDILLTPDRSAVYRWLTQRVLRACTLTTSDSAHMARRMRELGAGEVMTFPFGLDALPARPTEKRAWLFYANRGLEPLYRPDRVLAFFAQVARQEPSARLIVANDGSLAASLPAQARALGLSVNVGVGGSVAADAEGWVTAASALNTAEGAQVQFVGRLDAAGQAHWYAQAQWYLSLPESDSVSVSVLEAMAQGCIPLLSDLPANRELVRHGVNGLIVDAPVTGLAPAAATAPLALMAQMYQLLAKADPVADHNRAWVTEHGLFAPAVARFLARLEALQVPAS